MPRKALLRQTILNHADPAEPQTGATWSSLEGPVRVGRVSRVTEAELRLPSEAAAPHFSLLLLLEGQGHFHMPDAQDSKQGRYLEFLPGHCYLSCSYQPFRCEDYVPANISFRAIFLHFPLPLRCVVEGGAPASHAAAQVLAHRDGHAWIARLAMAPAIRSFASGLMAQGLPQQPLELLQVQYRSLEILHSVVSSLLLKDAADMATAATVSAAAPPAASAQPHLSSRDRRQLLEARRFIDAHLAEPLRLADVAAACGLSESTLKTGFRVHFDSSVYDYVIQQRCLQAVRLLRDTPLSVLDVALRCGFSSASLLARHFRAHVGRTPLQVRHG